MKPFPMVGSFELCSPYFEEGQRPTMSLADSGCQKGDESQGWFAQESPPN